MKLRTFLELGRSSNLPTVVSNTICGAVLAASALTASPSVAPWSSAAPWSSVAPWSSAPFDALQLRTLGASALACCALYVGGMFLNDAFDAAWDRQHRPERPIPSGAASEREVFTWSAALLGIGLAVALLGVPSGGSLPAVLLACGFTVTAIVAYNRWHKGFRFAPWIMGACRVGVIAIAALMCTPSPPLRAAFAAGSVGVYVVGLTHVARFETKTHVGNPLVAWLSFTPSVVVSTLLLGSEWSSTSALTLLALGLHVTWVARAISSVRRGEPRAIPKAVGGLIAGLSLVDAAFVASVGAWPWVLVCWACFSLTLLAQRRIAGT